LAQTGRQGAAAVLALALALLLVACSAAAAAPPRILAFGDSLTAGLGLNPEQAFPARLQARLAAGGIDVQVLNGGVSGDTTADGVARLDWALADHPDVVLVELGANDALRGIDPKLAYANLDKILGRLKASGAQVMLLGMAAPANWGRDYQQDFAAIYPALASKYKVPLYPFFLDGVALDASLNQRDGMHPNARGADIIAEKVAPYVARLLKETGAPG
jgi:acyl-CoA thioesterase-1